jgi:hypothetical protein
MYRSMTTTAVTTHPGDHALIAGQGQQDLSRIVGVAQFAQGSSGALLRTEPVEELPVPEMGPVLATAAISLPHLEGVARGAASDESRPTLASIFLGHDMHCPECGSTQMVSGRCWKCAKLLSIYTPSLLASSTTDSGPDP